MNFLAIGGYTEKWEVKDGKEKNLVHRPEEVQVLSKENGRGCKFISQNDEKRKTRL